jgi:hypothetical protein
VRVLFNIPPRWLIRRNIAGESLVRLGWIILTLHVHELGILISARSRSVTQRFSILSRGQFCERSRCKGCNCRAILSIGARACQIARGIGGSGGVGGFALSVGVGVPGCQGARVPGCHGAAVPLIKPLRSIRTTSSTTAEGNFYILIAIIKFENLLGAGKIQWDDGDYMALETFDFAIFLIDDVNPRSHLKNPYMNTFSFGKLKLS